ncbi:hypothetical protein BABINDRAFT_9840 [Babjeviella inositovora NRRL Y-12698]|uniref:t-SNARE coiled-coil homology domain-containing protein n=1 Tax=Babjeviella inositovora NRRL Y-12698 TaxID=984486 RepID=A0A1E3QLJ3_9ASCO|nr:uncharacterized protein BABINDRAFT_9840 [Babjeviella inositovora NRRL Y-12698]ODQ77857.1 hypothetical protein BABINDRAFT_9840 [Babjeviella inositovora NRRL Y-12698]
MPPSTARITILLDQLAVLVEERERLTLLNVKPSKLENMELHQLLAKVVTALNTAKNSVDEEIKGETSVAYLRKQMHTLEDKSREYDGLLHKLVDDINTSEYTVDMSFDNTKTGTTANSTPKSVRFKDNLIEEEPLHITETSFKPYRDDESELYLFDGRNTGLEPTIIHHPYQDTPNQEILQQQQVHMIHQDSRLESLSASINKQRTMGLHINEELGEQNIMLDDIEAQLDSTGRKLVKGHAGLRRFTLMLSSNNAHWWTILVLALILMILLVVLN